MSDTAESPTEPQKEEPPKEEPQPPSEDSATSEDKKKSKKDSVWKRISCERPLLFTKETVQGVWREERVTERLANSGAAWCPDSQ